MILGMIFWFFDFVCDLIYDIPVDAKCEIMLFYHDKSQNNVVTCDVSRNS